MMLGFKIIKYGFWAICIVGTWLLVGMWFIRYSLDEDKTVIENSAYYETADDVYPVMSLCFIQTSQFASH